MKDIVIKGIIFIFSSICFFFFNIGCENYLKTKYKEAKKLIKEKKYKDAIPILKDIISQRKYRDSEKLLKLAIDNISNSF